MGRVINVGDDAYGKGDFKPIPSGTKLNVTVFAIEETTVRSQSSANFGQPQLDVTFKVQDGEYAGREIRYQKIPLYDGPSAWKLTTFAEAVGWKAGKGSGVELPDNVADVLGTALVIKVQEDAPNGKGQVFNSVNGFAPAGVGGSTEAQSSASVPSWSSLNG